MYANSFRALRRKKGLHPSTPHHPPSLAAVKDSMFIVGEEVEGEEVGTGAASSWRRGEGRGSRKRKRRRRKTGKFKASPQKTIFLLIQNCIGPTFRISR